jgi:pheromone shutdown protein TraB
VTALPPPGVLPGASVEVLLAALHLLRSQAALFVGYIETVQPAEAHGVLAAYVRGRCEEVMLEVDLHLSMLNPGAAT